jgi:phage terminase large subunit
MAVATMRHTPILTKLLSSDKKIIVNEGGSSSSKTISALQGLLILATQERGKTFSVVRASLPWIKKGPLKDFRDVLDWSGTRSLFHENKTDFFFECKSTGTRIEFFGIDDLEKAKGPRRDRLFVNEATEISYDIYRQLAMRTRGQIWIDYNPSLIEWWIDSVIKREDCEFIHSTYKDNTFLTPEMIREIEVEVPVYELFDGETFADWDLEIEELIRKEKGEGGHRYQSATLVAGDPYNWSVYGSPPRS